MSSTGKRKRDISGKSCLGDRNSIFMIKESGFRQHGEGKG